jgi:hypothetical protein
MPENRFRIRPDVPATDGNGTCRDESERALEVLLGRANQALAEHGEAIR